MSSIYQIVAWLALASIIFATAAPIRWRPKTAISVNIERSAAFAFMALLFVMAYPNDRRIVGIGCILGAAATELLQVASPTRHPRVEDAIIKGLGATVGLLFGGLLLQAASLYQG
ncbi:MAG: VanZ family protein [Rhizobiaceae bacterium]|nr:VanZ family protein [Rhizobiaceae bacterium]